MKHILPNLTDRQLRTARSKAVRSLNSLIALGDGIPVNFIGLENLAESNPQDGLEPLLTKTCSMLFPVYLLGRVDVVISPRPGGGAGTESPRSSAGGLTASRLDVMNATLNGA